jgi:putative transposase
MRYVITEEIWEVFSPMVQRCGSPLGPEPELPDRTLFDAELYLTRTG